jgi:hypothetical protein
MYRWQHWPAEEVVDRAVVTVMKLVVALREIEEGGEEVTISYGNIYYSVATSY